MSNNVDQKNLAGKSLTVNSDDTSCEQWRWWRRTMCL